MKDWDKKITIQFQGNVSTILLLSQYKQYNTIQAKTNTDILSNQ